MNYILKNGSAYVNGAFADTDILVKDGVIAAIGKDLTCADAEVIDCTGKTVVPGLVDLHVHLREPGFEYKETVATGTAAAAAPASGAGCQSGVCEKTPPKRAHRPPVLPWVASGRAEIQREHMGATRCEVLKYCHIS